MKRLLRRLATAAFARFPGLTERWLDRNPMAVADDVPWTPFTGTLAGARLGLVTTAGVHGTDQPAFDTGDPDGDAGWRVLDGSLQPGAFTITHDYYDTTSARADLDVVFPLRRARELVRAGRLGGLTEQHAGLMGHVDGPLLETLTSETAPAIAEMFRDQRADIVLLAPA